MSDLDENVVTNPHGASLRIRRFRYLSPDIGVAIGCNTIDSNQLRHVQTHGTLLVNVALCKVLGNSTAKLYVRFLGYGPDVVKLKNAVMPLLASCGFKALPETQG